MALQGQQQGQPQLQSLSSVLTVEDWHKQRLEVRL